VTVTPHNLIYLSINSDEISILTIRIVDQHGDLVNFRGENVSIIGFTLNGELITNNLSNLKVHLNSESLPYDNLNVDFSKNHYAHLYEMCTRFQSSYFNRESQPFLTSN